MDNMKRHLLRRGIDCIIQRDPPQVTKISMRIITRASRDESGRESYCEGVVLADSNLQSGEVIEIEGARYLVQSVNADPTFGELVFFAAKVNASLTHQRYQETVDPETGNIVQEWVTLNASLPVFGQAVTAALRQVDPGLLETTKYIFFVSKTAGVQLMDRVVFDGKNLHVNAVDDIMLPGVARIQAGQDVRP